ncbi:hypothetical protein [Massilia sp. TS11]|uniref:hypothetical protein n=1 Tax=Massilia sp. TS11 TaxID=2908003 RepID=UPI001EDBA34D|nr:hypothetical protein [Massilia sp. TS11]MCG2586616.1 hypothetical protein [Massilia sp. TS11]
MKPYLAAFLLSIAVTNLSANPIQVKLTGNWKITEVLDNQETVSLSDEEAKSLIGTKMIVTADRIQFGGADCRVPQYKTEKHKMYAYFVKEFNFEPKRLPLPDAVTEIQVTCQDPVGIDFIYVRDQRQIVLYWKGFFLNAVRQAH